MWGKLLNRWIGLLSLTILVVVSIACSSGGDFLAGSQTPSRDVFDNPLPASFNDQFKSVPGGDFTSGSTYQTTYVDFDGVEIGNATEVSDALERYNDYTDSDLSSLDATEDADRIENGNEELNDNQNGIFSDDENINEFLMMKNEVTIGMFVDFLNAISAKGDELSNAGEGETTSFTASEIIYKPIMDNEALCGIYQFDFGERVNQVYDQDSGLALEKPTAGEYVDPYVQIQKPRFASDSLAYSYEVAPGRNHYPMVFVSQSEAKEFCRWLGPQYRLPTWQEWTWAASGGEANYQFPTSDGNLFLNGFKVANFQYSSSASTSTRIVGSTGPANPFGLFDLAGNVYEWTYFKEEDQSSEGSVPYTNQKFVMGGSHKTRSPSILATWFRFGLFTEDVWTNDLGFRVIFDKNSGSSAADNE